MRFSVKRTDNDKDMIEEYQLRVLPETAANEQALRRYVAREKGKDERTLTAIRVLKRSIDARQRTIFVNLKLRVYVNEQPEDDEFVRTAYRNVEGRPQVVVVGAGPGGLFAALRLIEAGYRPVIVERGKNVRDRKLDLAKISREHKVDSESNYSFGEGGENPECILSTRCQCVHLARRPSPHRDGQTSESHREHAQDDSGLRGRSAFRDPYGCLAHRERHGGGDRDEHGEDLPRAGYSGHRAFGA